MKPPAFDYVRPKRLEEALAALAQDGARPLAGGQSLMPLLNLRLVHPSLLVDLNDLEELKTVEVGPEEVRIGALVRHQEILRHPLVRQRLPILPRAAAQIGHRAIRERGTIGGSLAHADPAAEWPTVLTALDASVEVVSTAGRRLVPLRSFFTTYFGTVLQPGELLTAIRIPTSGEGGWGFAEWKRRPGDFALVVVAGVARAGQIELAFGGLSDRPVLLRWATDVPLSSALPGWLTSLPVMGDIHGSPGLRRRLARALAETVWSACAGGGARAR